jgi:N-acyl-L-homoserine lactone synthetase
MEQSGKLGVFELTVTRSPVLLVESYRLRHAVYSGERHYREPASSGIDTDEYDADAVHIVALLEGKVIATTRLILPSAKGLPVFAHCEIDAEHSHLVCDARCAEVSRVAVPREYRSLGLARELYRLVVSVGLSFGMARCVGAMEPTLARLLVRAGYQVRKIGPTAYYFGVVSPYLLEQSS